MELAINSNCLSELASSLHHDLLSATLEERAAIRQQTVASFCRHRQNLRSVGAIVHLIFDQRSEEYNLQVTEARGPEKVDFEIFQRIAQSELSDDTAIRAAQWATIQNWGAEFLLLILHLRLMDQETNTFWSQARAASNRVHDWDIARSMLNLRIFNVHNQKQSWISVCTNGHQIRPEYFKDIKEGASLLTQQEIDRYKLEFDQYGLIDFTNWRQLKALLQQNEGPTSNVDGMPDDGDEPSEDPSQQRISNLQAGEMITPVRETESAQEDSHRRAIPREDISSDEGSLSDDDSMPSLEQVISSARKSRNPKRPSKHPILEHPPGSSNKKPRTMAGADSWPQVTVDKYLSSCSESERCAYAKREAESRQRLDKALEDILSCLTTLDTNDEENAHDADTEGEASSGADDSDSDDDDDVDYGNAQGDEEVRVQGSRQNHNRDDLYRYALPLLSPETSPPLATEWTPIMTETDCLSTAHNTRRRTADVWSVTPNEACALVASNTIVLDKPLILRTGSPNSVASDWFMDNLLRHIDSDGRIDVQRNDRIGTRSVKAKRIVKRIRKKLDRRRMSAYQPLNCLNISDLPFSEGEPQFIRHPRFRLGDILASRLERKKAFKPQCASSSNIGKKTFDKPARSKRAIDIETSQKFHLFSSAYTVSRFHRDCYNCTWVKCVAGVKAWFLKFSAADDDARLVILRPGDILFMPAGTYMEHAVVTLEGPCIMVGGQRFDARRIIPQLDHIGDLIKHPSLTNEDVPAFQLPEFLDEMIEYANEDPGYFTDDINSFEISGLCLKRDEIKAVASCTCASMNSGRTPKCNKDTCQCYKNDRQCTSWCIGHTVLPCSVYNM